MDHTMLRLEWDYVTVRWGQAIPCDTRLVCGSDSYPVTLGMFHSAFD